MSTSHDDGWTFTGFVFPTTTPIPDQIFDELLHLLSGNELKVLLYICRRTFGFKKESDTISLSQMVSGITTRDGRALDLGTGLSKATVARCLNSLEEKKIIQRIRQFSDERGDEPTTYALNMVSTLSHFETGGVSLMRQGGVSSVRQGGVSVLRQGGVSPVRHTTNSITTNSRQQTDNNSGGEPAPENGVVVALLREKGISEKVALRLADRYNEERIREKIDFLAYLQEHDAEKVKSPQGWLRRAIEENYRAPDGYGSPKGQGKDGATHGGKDVAQAWLALLGDDEDDSAAESCGV